MRSKTPHRAFIFLPLIFSAFLFLAIGARCAAEEFYRPKPEDVPGWAKQGMFHFIRIDGGRIESMKAERTWWGRDFPDGEKEVLSGIYTKYQDKLFEKLKEASFNWVWVTWSNGWSTQAEKDNRNDLKRLIKRAHAENIKVTAYVSATNIFWESTFIDEPETLPWVMIKDGKPVPYAAQLTPMRFLCDARLPGWRKYIITKAALAIDAGADAVFFDNVIGDKDGLKTLFSEFQEMAVKKAKKSGRPKAFLIVNAHIDPERMDINDVCEFIWNEYGKNTPGVWPGMGWDVDNVRKTRFLAGAKYPWQPVMYEDDKYKCGPRETCIPTPVEQKLSIAEAWAFGSSFSRNIEGRFLKALIKDEPEALDAWAAISQYNKWFLDNGNIYTEAEMLAKIALLAVHNGAGYSGLPDHAMANEMIKSNIMFGTKVIKRLDRGEPLEKFEVLLIPDVVDKIDANEAKLLIGYAERGGKVYARRPDAAAAGKGDPALYDKLKYTPIPETVTERISKGETPTDFFAEVERASGGPLLKLENSGNVAANFTRCGNSFCIHFVNYDHDKPAENIRVRLDIKGLEERLGIPDLEAFSVQLVSPDFEEKGFVGTPCKGDVCEFTIPKVEHYLVAMLVD